VLAERRSVKRPCSPCWNSGVPAMLATERKAEAGEARYFARGLVERRIRPTSHEQDAVRGCLE